MRAADLGDAHPVLREWKVLAPMLPWCGPVAGQAGERLPAAPPARIPPQPHPALKALPQAAAPLFLLGLPGDLHEKVIYKT